MSVAAKEGDTRVLSAGDQDATMEDIGDKGRPPDPSGSWVGKVKGSSVGGRLIPEEVLDDGFVTERLCLEFPDGEDGEPVITIGKEVLDAMNGLWKRCMIVKVLGRNVSIAVLNRKLRELWNPKGGMYVMDLPRQFFMIRFAEDEDHMTALTGGPWRAFGSYLMVKAWSPEFDPLRDEITTTPVWVRISNLPVNFYHRSILMGIAKGLGNPIKADATTLNFERARFARVCVEVNLKKPLKGTVMINGERYYVAYEGLSNICSLCGLYGHLVHACPTVAKEKVAVTTTQALAVVASTSGSVQLDDGFTPVRQSRRKPEFQRKTVSPAVKGGGGERGNNSRDSGNMIGDTGNIRVSNKFGMLEENMESLELREGVRRNNANKENENTTNQVQIGQSGAQAKLVFGGNMEKARLGSNEGFKEKKHYVVRPKQARVVQPMRGLVFGPSKDEKVMSLSGKRLRVEKGNVGRPGGYFATRTIDSRNDGVLEQAGKAVIPGNDVESGGGPTNTEMVIHRDPLVEDTGTHGV